MCLDKLFFDVDCPLKKGKKFRLLSLFSGCGGMDLGFEGGFEVLLSSYPDGQKLQAKQENQKWVTLPTTPFQIVFANDISPEARVLWQHYFCQKYKYDPSIYHESSIVDLVKLHKSGVRVFPDNIDIVTGGFPCQDFSVAGKRRGFLSNRSHRGEKIIDNNATEETRGQLYMWMKEVIELTKPKIFIAENVKGLVNLDNVKDIIQSDFSSVDNDGYIVLPPKVLHAARYGVPQTRERVIFIGIRRSALLPQAKKFLSQRIIPSKYDPYPPETHHLPSEQGALHAAVVSGDVLSHLKEPHLSEDESQKVYSKAKFMGVHCQGQKEIDLSQLAPTIRSEHHGNIEFRRLSKLNGGKNELELSRGLAERRLTPRECASVQTFLSDYDFVIKNSLVKGRYLVSPSAAYKAIGNAVPPLLAFHIARRLSDVWSLYFGSEENGYINE